MGGPPGEAEVLALNPRRRDLILQATKWPNLVPGSLNLEVAVTTVEHLLHCVPVIREDGKDVQYPAAHARIPILRVGYLYFAARLSKGDRVVSVLIRRAVNPLPTRIEAFSDRLLREALVLSDSDTVMCVVEDGAARSPSSASS